MLNFKRILFISIFILLLIFISGCTNDFIPDFNSNIFSVTYSPQQAEQALNYAISKEGSPYEWGGNGPDQFDCSGLIIWAYRQVNYNFILRISNFYSTDATVDDIYNYNIQKIPPPELRPGDIVFFTHDENRIAHGGLFIDWLDSKTFKYIHASKTSKHEEVRIDIWNINYNNYQWFVGGGRLLRY